MKRSTLTKPLARDADAERARARYNSAVAMTGLRIQARGGRQVSIVADAPSHRVAGDISSDAELVDLIRANTALLGEVCRSPDIERFVVSLGAATGTAAAVFDPMLQPLAIYDPDMSMAQFAWMRTRDRLGDLVTAASAGHSSVPGTSSAGARYPAHVIAPIRSDTTVQAYLVIATWKHDVIGSAWSHMTEQTAAIAAVVLSKSTFPGGVDDSVDGNIESAAVEALAADGTSARRTFQLLRRSLGVTADREYRIVVFSPGHRTGPDADDPAVAAIRESVYTGVLEPLRSNFQPVAVGYHDDQLIVILERPRSSALVARLADFVVEYAKSRAFPLDLAGGVSPIGWGNDLHTLLGQARQARAAARLLRMDDRVVEFEKLGLGVLFSSLTDTAMLEAYVHHILGSLLEYDEAHGTELVPTLAAYLRHAGSQQAAARELHVHSNTVNYRLARVREFVPLATHSERLAVEVAVHIHETLHGGAARDSA
jgi:PucR C-terminal helix-turn-helix domain